MANTEILDERYPLISLWVRDYGWIEIGQDDHSRSFVRVLDEGGLVWEGEEEYSALENAFEAMEEALAEFMRQLRT